MAETERHEGAITEPIEGQPLDHAADKPAVTGAPPAAPPPPDATAERHEGAITEPQEGSPLAPAAEPDAGAGSGT